MNRRALDVSSSGEYYTARVAQQEEVEPREQHSSPSPDEHGSHRTLGVQHFQQGSEVSSQRWTGVTSSGEFMTMPSVGAESYGTKATLRSAESRTTTTNGNDFVTSEVHQQQLQPLHVQQRNHPYFALDPAQDNAHNHHHPHDLGGLRSGLEPGRNDAHALKPPMAGGNKILLGPARQKHRWQIQESDSGEEGTSSEADDDGSSQDDVTSTLSVKGTNSVEYVVETDWVSLHKSQPSSSENRQVAGTAAGQGQQQQQPLCIPSEDSDRPFDLYENLGAHVQDYEPSDTSSTTMEEVDINGVGGSFGQLSGEIDPYLPRAIGQGISVPVPKSNIPLSGATFSSSSSYGSQIELGSLDNHAESAPVNNNLAARRHSWDDGVSSEGTVLPAPGYTGPPRESPLSVRQKSSSQDYASGQQADYLHTASSDPSERGYSNTRGRPLPTLTSSYDNHSKQAIPFVGRPSVGAQQPWVNRYVPASHSIHQQWLPNSSSHHRPYVPEPSSLHPLQSRLSSSARGQIQTAELPPKQGLYPPLPLPGALQRVLCQQCGVLLVVPENLMTSQKVTQKLRCGSCRMVSIYSVLRADSPIAVQLGQTSARTHLSQNDSAGLLPSSPDLQEFSSYRPVTDSLAAGEKQRNVRLYSVSDVAELKQQVQQVQGQESVAREQSRGNEDTTELNQELQERALSERFGILSMNSNLSASHVQDALSTGSGAESPSSPHLRYINNIALYRNAPHKLPVAERKLSSEGIMSDSDSESMQRTPSAASSPRLNHLRSPSNLPNRSPQLDPTTSERASADATIEQVHEAGRSFNRTINRLFRSKKNKQTGSPHYRRKVVVNGVPIPDHLVKNAEEHAGPVHPGTYWYDSQAGFWGVAGGPCLGIIPPFIEEFKYPMTRDCAAGRTGIFVNGRELHQSDKEKLCRRGLPDAPGMSYLIEIDGRVVDEATCSELRSLGRLAPSLEKNGRGAGMHVPSNVSGRG